MTRRLNIVSVCRVLPRPDDRTEGIFVFRRIAAMSESANVRIVQPVPFFPFARPLPRWARAAGRTIETLEVFHAPMPYVPGVLKSLDAFWLARAITPVLESLHRAAPIDLIDAHFGYPDGAGSVLAGRRLAIPTFVTLRGLEHDRIREAVVGRSLLAALRSAAGCVAVSETLKSLVVSHGVDVAKVRVVHNAIDATTFHFGERAVARARLDVPAQGPLIVSVGRLIAAKRHHELIDAFAALKQQMPAALLILIGAPSFEPHYPDRLRRRVEGLGLGGAVRFVRSIPQTQVADWLRAADVFALLSEREGCCNAVLEALAVGVPVVVTPAGDNATFVKPGVNGELVPIGDTAAATRSLERVIARQDWRRECIARDLVTQVGSWQSVGERVLEFFRERLEAPEASMARVGEGA